MERTEGICRRRSNPIRVTCNQPGNVHLHLCGRLPPKRKKRSHTHQEETSCLNETFHTSTMCLEGKRSRRCNSQGRDFRSRTTLQVICWVIHFTFCWQSGTPPPPPLCVSPGRMNGAGPRQLHHLQSQTVAALYVDVSRVDLLACFIFSLLWFSPLEYSFPLAAR